MHTLDTVDPAWAWARFQPSAAEPWDLSRAAHLFRQAGFSAGYQELVQAVAAGPEATLERLLSGGIDTATFYAEAESTIGSLLSSSNLDNLPAWWLHVMLHTPHPLLEKMTLFWHGHFATSAAKVTEGRMMIDQNRLLRQHALGKFGPLLDGMTKDPAMLVWLDSTTNRKSRPNENFAREVMELFSMGLGNYTERDIKEVARAFTGFELRRGSFKFNRYQHDAGPKQVLGQTGEWTGDDVIKILLTQPVTGRFLVRKLFNYFVSDQAPPDRLVDPLAREWAAHEYDTAWVVRTILASNLLYSPLGVRQRIKAPVELAIGLLRALEGQTNTYALADDLIELGQAVFFPPNVKGWDGGTDWINASTLLARANLVWALVGGTDDRYGNKVPLEKITALADVPEPARAARRVVELLIAGSLPDAVQVRLAALASDPAGGDERLRRARVVQAIATLPEFQLA